MTRRSSFLALLMLIILAPEPAAGDDGVFRGTGGAVIASTSRSVRMTAEEVVLDLTETGVVHGNCTFVFTNAGGPESLLIGFPDRGRDIDDSPLPDSLASGPSIYDLLVSVDGQEVLTTLVPIERDGNISRAARAARLGGFSWVHTWPCFFDSMQTRILHTEYRHPTSIGIWDPCMLHYVLSTGASWAGPIGKALIRVVPGQLRLKNAYSPPNWIWTGTEYIWTAEDFEPDVDVLLSLQDPAAYVACLVDSWPRLRERVTARSPYDSGGLLSSCGPIRRQDFFQAVRAQLGDSLSDLRARLEDIYASENRSDR